MAAISNQEAVTEKVAFVKRNCTLCKGRSRLRPVENEINNVRSGLDNMIDFFQQQFNALRRDDAPVVEIKNAIENKRLCMDLLEECKACNKEVDKVNRGLNKIKE